jgi:GTP-binding nuclear protein Ran
MARPFNIALVGDGGVGKTAYTQRFLDGKFVKSYIATVGCEVHPFELGKVIFQMWDTPGQEKFEGVRENYYKGADAAILMFDLTSPVSYANIKLWYEGIRAVKPDIPIVLVGNKCDSTDRKLFKRDITFHREHDMAYYDVSVKDNFNTQRVLEKLAQVLKN